MFSSRSRSSPRALIQLMRSELRQAIRTLVKSPGFAVSAILILGLGCAASTSIFSVAYSVLVRDLPYPAPDRLVSVSTRLPHAVVSKAPAGAALGILGADSLLKLLVPLLPSGLPRVEEIAIHPPVLLFTIALSTAGAFAVSIAPALKVSAILQRGAASNSRVRDLLICAEIACTVVLLISAGLLMRSFLNVRATNPGFRPDHVLGLHIAVDRSTHGNTDPEVWRYLSRLIDRVRSTRGVESAAVVNRLPLGGQAQTLQIEIEGRGTKVNIDSRSASPNYFRTLGIPLLAGRASEMTTSPAEPMSASSMTGSRAKYSATRARLASASALRSCPACRGSKLSA